MRTATLRLFLLALFLAPSAWAQSGKISGRVTDASLGEPLPGVNVVIDGTTRGAITDGDGYYTILNVGPGTYALRFSFLGYATQIVEGVDVNIEETTTVDAALQDEALGLDEVVVRAERPVVQPDVSNSRLNVSAAELQSLPAPTIESIVTLQPGIQDGFVVRGSAPSQLSFMVNGFLLRNERDNSPLTQTPISAVEEIQVQTGGFNAEYGNVRSGVVNVVTKEGREDRYEATAIVRYSAPGQKNFGPLANDPDSFWIRRFIDPEVAFVGTGNGTNGPWDQPTVDQYGQFEGWISVSESLLRDDDPTNDMTPEALQQAFLYQHRKSFEITEPDYDVDIGLGGPVPGVSRQLGGLRFYGAYRQTRSLYVIPLNTDSYLERTGHLKLTSNVASGMKLSVEGRIGNQEGTSASRSGNTGIFQSASGIADNLTSVSFIDARLFSTDYWNPTNVRYNQLSATFTHALNNSTFYQAKLSRLAFKHETFLGRPRDTTAVAFFGGVGFDEAPFGFEPRPTFGVDGMRTGVGFSNGRDTSEVATYNLQLDLTSQITPTWEVKTGLEYNLTDQDINYGQFDAFLPSANANFRWSETPARGALYGQSKLEFKGMIANLGLRGEYFHAGGDFYDFERFDPAFASQPGNPLEGLDTLLTPEPTERIFTLSPRLGVSFPVTAVSKLFVNYGHFRSLPQPTNLFLFGYFTESGLISSVPNPNNPLPKTVAYELGYEQSFFDQFLVRLAGYYKDVTFEPRSVVYRSRDGRVEYSLQEPNGYADTRGFEITLKRDRGNWVQGFLNYTYMVDTGGFFGFRRIEENTTEQQNLENLDSERRAAQSRPVPRPYARLNLDFFTPNDFGPRYSGFNPLGGWRISLVGQWQDGGNVTWAGGGGGAAGILNNVDVADPWRFDLRFARTFDVRGRELTFFADIFNLTNRRQFSSAGFENGVDRDKYLGSLHLPASEDYDNIVGDDNFGTYRDFDVAYVPMLRCEVRSEDCGSLTTGMPANALYYEASTGTYLSYQDGTFAPADQSFVNQVLDDKAYIDMPNQSFLTFLGPRDVFFGLRLKL